MAVANQVQFGLSASIFTRDLGKALEFARRIEAGIVTSIAKLPVPNRRSHSEA